MTHTTSGPPVIEPKSSVKNVAAERACQNYCSWSLSGICESVIEIFCDEVFMVNRKTVKNGQFWCSAVICRKRRSFDMHFHVIVVSIFSKTFVKDRGDSSGRLREKRIWLGCIEALLLAVHSFWTCIFDALFHSFDNGVIISPKRRNIFYMFMFL